MTFAGFIQANWRYAWQNTHLPPPFLPFCSAFFLIKIERERGRERGNLEGKGTILSLHTHYTPYYHVADRYLLHYGHEYLLHLILNLVILACLMKTHAPFMWLQIIAYCYDVNKPILSASINSTSKREDCYLRASRATRCCAITTWPWTARYPSVGGPSNLVDNEQFRSEDEELRGRHSDLTLRRTAESLFLNLSTSVASTTTPTRLSVPTSDRLRVPLVL